MSGSTSGAGGGGRARATAHELARYEALFASRTRTMKSSAMREMMALTERPDVISLAGGLPDTSTFPPELFAALFDEVAATATARALQYGPTEGMAAAVDCVVEVMTAEGTAVDRDEVIITTGGQQVIDLVCKALIDPGDVIVAEAPTYPGAVPTFGAYQADVAQIEMDGEGMPIGELERTLDQLEADGRRPKFIYTIPNFQNPGGETMPLARRRELVALARERELLVLEDNPYGLLRYEGEPLPTLYSLDALAGGSRGGADLVIYLGTFSKILSPGIRLGWAVAPRPVLEKLNLGKQGADLCSSSLTQLFVAEYFKRREAGGEPAWLAYLERLRALYGRRRDVMLEALEEHFGERGSWTRPLGGMFIWATLDERIDTTDLLALARTTERVAFVPGSAAYVDGRSGRSSMRLNFAGNSEEHIREGIRRIGSAVRTQMGLIATLSGSPAAGAAKSAGAPDEPAVAAAGPGGAGAVREAAGETAGDKAGEKAEGPAMADVVELPRRGARGSSRRRRDG